MTERKTATAGAFVCFEPATVEGGEFFIADGERIFMEQSRKFDEARRLASAPPVTLSLTLISSLVTPNPAQSPAVP